jgi:endoglucanase
MIDLESLKAAIRQTTIELAAIPGIPGHEQAVAAEVRRRLERITDEVTVDRFGNVFGLRRGRSDGPRLMLAAHTDEIGFLVKSVEPAGFLRFERLGGATEFSLIGQKVIVDGRHQGVIGGREEAAARLRHVHRRRRRLGGGGAGTGHQHRLDRDVCDADHADRKPRPLGGTCG